MNQQQMYNVVVNHLRSGNAVRGRYGLKNDDGSCSYCAKGILMDFQETDSPYLNLVKLPEAINREIHTVCEQFYDTDISNYMKYSKLRKGTYSRLGRHLTGSEVRMLDDLEQVHEGWFSTNNDYHEIDKEVAFIKIAESYGLQYTQIKDEVTV